MLLNFHSVLLFNHTFSPKVNTKKEFMKSKSLIPIIYNIKEVIEEDKDHRIKLKSDYTVGTFTIPMPDFDCSDFYIIEQTFIVKKEASCIDGASCAPDKFIIDMACGYIHTMFGISILKKWQPIQTFKL